MFLGDAAFKELDTVKTPDTITSLNT